MWLLGLLWPISGWLCLYFSTPKYMFKGARIPFYIAMFCVGVIIGPVGVVFFLFDNREI